MASLNDLVAGLHADAPLDGHGEFSLDAEKAREKLREFQLAVPEHYVLLIVQVAVLRGAQRIHLFTDSDDVYMRFDGDPFTADELGDLFPSIFVESDEPSLRALQNLAVAVNAAMSTRPSFVKVTTPEAELELRPERPDRLARPTFQRELTQIHVRDRLHFGLLVEVVRSLQDRLPEAMIVRERCRFSDRPVQITINDEVLARVRPVEELLYARSVPLLGGRGYAGFARRPIEPSLDIVTSEVWISRHKFFAPDGMSLWAFTDRLAKDASQAEVVRDHRYDNVIGALTSARDQAIIALAEDIRQGKGPTWASGSLREWLIAALPLDGAKALTSVPVLSALASLPFWRTLRGVKLTTCQLLEEESVWISERPPEEAFGLSEIGDIVFAEADEVTFFKDQLGLKIVRSDARIGGAIERERNRRAWRARPHDGHLGAHHLLAREKFVSEGACGEVGLSLSGSVRSTALIVAYGCVIEELPLMGPTPGLTAVISGPFDLLDDFSGVRRDGPLAFALLQLFVAVERLYTSASAQDGAELAEELRRALLIYIDAITLPEAPSTFLIECGYSEEEALRHIESCDHRLFPAWNLRPISDQPREPHPMTALALIPTTIGEPLSLLDVARRRVDGERLWWLAERAENIDEVVLCLSPGLRRLVTQALGEHCLEDYLPRLAAKEDEVRRAAARKSGEGPSLTGAALQREPELGDLRAWRFDHEPPPSALISVSMDHAELSGHLWIAPSPDPQQLLTSGVDFGRDGKVVGNHGLLRPLLISGALSGSAVTVDDRWGRVELDPDHHQRITQLGCSLWSDLGSEYRRGIAALLRTGTMASTTRERLVLLRDALWCQLLTVRAANEGSNLNERLRLLAMEIAELDLLPLTSGRLISLNQALAEQPVDLLILGLWKPASTRPVLEPKPKPSPKPRPKQEIEPEPLPEPQPGIEVELPPEPPPRLDVDVDVELELALEPLLEPQPGLEVELPPEPPLRLDHELELELEPVPGSQLEPLREAEALLIEALRAELRLVRRSTQGPLREVHLRALTAAQGAGLRIVEVHGCHYTLDLQHPLVRAARDRGGDEPILISMLASGVYTFLNDHLEEIEDEHEAAFHRHHCEHILRRLTLSSCG